MKPLAVGPGPLSRCFQELLDQKIIVRLQQQFLERHWLSPTLMGIDFLHHELGAKKAPAQKKNHVNERCSTKHQSRWLAQMTLLHVIPTMTCQDMSGCIFGHTYTYLTYPTYLAYI